jgi:hypothetical protein
MQAAEFQYEYAIAKSGPQSGEVVLFVEVDLKAFSRELPD